MSWWRWAIGITGFGILSIKYLLWSKRYRGKVNLRGKTVLITGGNSGLGREAAFEFARREAKVILACRDVEKGKQTAEAIKRYTKNGVVVVKELDLASFKSIRRFAAEIIQREHHIDILVNNAGIFQCPCSKTDDGMETQFGVNHLGHFLLTNLLLELIKKSVPSRIVVVSSGLSKSGVIDFENLNSEKTYDKKAAYNNSKLANNYFAKELAKKLAGSGVGVHCLTPGMVRTNLGRHVKVPVVVKLLLYPLYVLLVKSPWEGIQTILYCSMAPELEGVSGKLYANCQEKPWPKNAQDDEVAKKLWEVSETLTKLA